MSTVFSSSELLLRPIVFTRPLRLVEPTSWVPHIPFAFWLVDALRPRTIVELGTMSGNSFSAFAQAVQILGLESACYAVDTWQGDPHASLYGEEVFQEWLTFHDQHFGAFSRLVRSTFDDALTKFGDGSIDLLHIDGYHTYEAVRHDFESWLPKLSHSAVVLLHDTNVREMDFGVCKFWQELSRDYPCFDFLHGHGLGVAGVGPSLPPDVRLLVERVPRQTQDTFTVRQFFGTLGEGLLRQPRDARQARVITELKSELSRGMEVLGLERDRAAAACTERDEARLELSRLSEELRRVLGVTSQSAVEVDQLEQHLQSHKATLEVRDATLRNQAAELGQMRAERRRIDATLRSREGELQQARARGDEQVRHHREIVARLEQNAARWFRAVQKLRASRSWRASAPLRVGGLLARDVMRRVRFWRPRPAAPTPLLSFLRPSVLRQARLIRRSGLFDEGFYLSTYPDVVEQGQHPLVHYLMTGAREGRMPSPLFDAGSYLDALGTATESNPLVHYLRAGAAERRNPHPLFDVEFYLSQASGVAGAGDPLTHYLEIGAARGWDPHPLFDTSYYLHHNPDVAAAGANPLAHYLMVGGFEGRNPHPLFHSAFYLERYSDVAAARVNPLVHFLKSGASEGRDPNPWFVTSSYVDADPSLRASRENPLIHFLRTGGSKEGLTGPDAGALHGLRTNLDEPARGLNPDGATPTVPAITRLPRVEDPVVSVIIPVHGQLGHTLKCLASIDRHFPVTPTDVLVVDDCSPDESLAVLSKIDGLQVISNETNLGFIRTCNKGAREATGKYLLFLNNDTEVLPGWCDEIVRTFKELPEAGIVGAKVLFPDGSLQEAGGIIWSDASGWNFGKHDEAAKPEYSYRREVDYVSGAALAIPRELFLELGGFDERYAPAYYEDADLAFRTREAGRTVVYQPLAQVIHHEGATSGTDLTKGVKAFQVRNAKTFLDRWRHSLNGHRHPGTDAARAKERGVAFRALVLDQCTPEPDKDAGSNAVLALMQVLQRLGAKVTFVPEDNYAFQNPYTVDLQRMGIEPLYAPYVTSLERYLQNHGALFDLVLIHRYNVGKRHLGAIRRYCDRARVVFLPVDLHYLRQEREASLRGDSGLKLAAALAKDDELAVVRAVDATIVHSTHERDVLSRECPDAPVAVYGWATDVQGTATPFASRKDIAFIGGYRHPPNVDAVFYFVREIFPLVRNRLPGVKFLMVGSNAPAELKQLETDDVILTGFVPDLSGLLDTVRVTVAPLRYGAGIKGKIMTSLSHGVPCVSSTIGTEGMPLTPGHDILVADDPVDFANALVDVYTTETTWTSLAENGQALVRSQYSVEQGRRIVQDALRLAGLPALIGPQQHIA